MDINKVIDIGNATLSGSVNFNDIIELITHYVNKVKPERLKEVINVFPHLPPPIQSSIISICLKDAIKEFKIKTLSKVQSSFMEGESLKAILYFR